MREPLALPELPSDLPDPLAAAIRAGDLDAVWRALSDLPRRQRRALVLRELGGLSYDELGLAKGVSQPAVESLLFRARRHLRTILRSTGAVTVPFALRDDLARRSCIATIESRGVRTGLASLSRRLRHTGQQRTGQRRFG